jgi:hypothetical protein
MIYWTAIFYIISPPPHYSCIAGKYTDKKENEIFLIYKEIKMGSVAKSYMMKGFLIVRKAQIFNQI